MALPSSVAALFIFGCCGALFQHASADADILKEKRAPLMRAPQKRPVHDHDHDLVGAVTEISSSEDHNDGIQSHAHRYRAATGVLASLQDASVGQLHAEFKRLATDDRKHVAVMKEGLAFRKSLKDDIITLVSKLDSENHRISELIPKSFRHDEKQSEVPRKASTVTAHQSSDLTDHPDDDGDMVNPADTQDVAPASALQETLQEMEDHPDDDGDMQDTQDVAPASALAETLSSELKVAPDGILTGSTATHIDALRSYIHHLRQRDDEELAVIKSNSQIRRTLKAQVQRRIKAQEDELDRASKDEDSMLPETARSEETRSGDGEGEQTFSDEEETQDQ